MNTIKNFKNNNKEIKIIDTFKTSFGFIKVNEFSDNGNRFFSYSEDEKLDAKKWQSINANLLIKLLSELDDKLIINNVKKFMSYLEPINLFYKSKVLDKSDNKTYSMKHFENMVKKHLGIDSISNADLLNIINDVETDFQLVDELGSQTKKSSFEKIKNKVNNNVVNNTFEGSNNTSKRLFTNDMAINFKTWYPNNKDTARKYNIERNLNMKYNTENSSEIDKYIKCYENEIENKKSTSNNNNLVSNNSVSLEL